MVIRMEIIPLAAIIAANFVPAPDIQTVVAPHQTRMEIEDGRTVVDRFGMTVADMMALEVFNANGQRLGEVDDVLADHEGIPNAVVVDVGGLLGMWEKEIAITLDAVRLDGRRLITDLTEAQIEALPDWY